MIKVPESDTELWGSPSVLSWWGCLLLLEWIFTLLLTLFQGLYFSVLVWESLWRVNFLHFVFIFSLTSTTSLGIWHTRNPWKSQAMFNCCGWFILLLKIIYLCGSRWSCKFCWSGILAVVVTKRNWNKLKFSQIL